MEIGDTIECANADDMIEIMQELAKQGIETDFMYEKKGKRGLWLIVTKVSK